MLDNKLREILQTPHEDSTGSTVMIFPTTKTLAQIKQVFADEGWQAPSIWALGTDPKGIKLQPDCLTGQEWYVKFWKAYETDLPKIADSTIIREQVDKAALKASGLKGKP